MFTLREDLPLTAVSSVMVKALGSWSVGMKQDPQGEVKLYPWSPKVAPLSKSS